MKTLSILILACCLPAFLLPGCDDGSQNGRIIVLGLDGMDPRAIGLMMSEGKLPNFQRLHREGAHGRLLSSKPMLSPVLWTTIATRKPPNQHGIGHLVALNKDTGEALPVTSEMRRVNAIWNILSEAEKRVAVVGWWATWPSEKINGTMVSDHLSYHFLFRQGETGAPRRS
jgi:predicted AlkP superfamily phosphohydrolase/phosphomutase